MLSFLDKYKKPWCYKCAQDVAYTLDLKAASHRIGLCAYAYYLSLPVSHHRFSRIKSPYPYKPDVCDDGNSVDDDRMKESHIPSLPSEADNTYNRWILYSKELPNIVM